MYSPSRILLHISKFFDGDKDRELFSWCSRRRESSSGVCVGAVLILVPLEYHLLAAKHYQIGGQHLAIGNICFATFHVPVLP